jgi:hypothetical protein
LIPSVTGGVGILEVLKIETANQTQNQQTDADSLEDFLGEKSSDEVVYFLKTKLILSRQILGKNRWFSLDDSYSQLS